MYTTVRTLKHTYASVHTDTNAYAGLGGSIHRCERASTHARNGTCTQRCARVPTDTNAYVGVHTHPHMYTTVRTLTRRYDREQDNTHGFAG